MLISGPVNQRDKLMNKVLLSMVCVLLLAIAFMQTISVRWTPPPNFDGHSYIAMAQDPIGAYVTISSHHYQRILPSLMVHFGARLTGIDISLGFYWLSHLGFLLLCVILFFVLFDLTRNEFLALVFAILILISSWPIVSNLLDIYQLTDLFTYIFALLMFWAIYRHNLGVFTFSAVCGIFSRQNLIILAVAGLVWFIVDLLMPLTKTPLHLPSTAKIVALVKGNLSLVFCAILVLGSIGLDFLIAKDNGQLALQHLFTFPHFALDELIVPFYLVSPFLLGAVFYWRALLRQAFKYWPITCFAVITIYQPFANWPGSLNAMRLMNQGVWFLQIAVSIQVATEICRQGFSWFEKILVALIPFAYGTQHLSEIVGSSFGPWGILPTNFRLLVNLMLVIPYGLSKRALWMASCSSSKSVAE